MRQLALVFYPSRRPYFEMGQVDRADIPLFMTDQPGKWLLFFSSGEKASIL